MSEDKVKKAFQESGIENRITCKQAFAMSAKYDISLKEIGEYCNSNAIKIHGCQMGCFK